MTTASTNTTIANTSNATFQAWVSEVLTNLITDVGLTQSADTGQINPATVALPGAANTSAGYAILEFNDTLQATAPIFIKLEFGTGNVVTSPQMWITIGTGSNGSGTLNGTVGTRVALGFGAALASTTTNYTSRYMYSATLGVAWMSFKIGASSALNSNAAIGGFWVARSVNSSGAPTATAQMLIANSSTGTGVSSQGGLMQCIDPATSTVYGPVAGQNNTWSAWTYNVLGSLSTVFGNSGQVFPVYQYAPTPTTPPYGITNLAALAVNSDIALHATANVTVLGSTTITYINAGCPFGSVSFATASLSALTYGVMLPWQ